jgi:hypothetical protein
MEAYCLKCRTKREVKNPESVTLKNMRPATRGLCPVCGTEVYRIGKREAITTSMSAKKVIKSWLADVPAEKEFLSHDGKVLKNLEELKIALREMSDETFAYHVTPDRNDFSKWVQEVVGDYELTTQLRIARTRVEAFEAVAKRVA